MTDELMNKEEKEIFEWLGKSLRENTSLAIEYAKFGCNQCQGKGYYQMDRILPNGTFVMVDGKESRVTPKETFICKCVRKNVIKSIKEIEVDAVA